MNNYHDICIDCGTEADLYELKANGCNIYWLCESCWEESYAELSPAEKQQNKHIGDQ